MFPSDYFQLPIANCQFVGAEGPKIGNRQLASAMLLFISQRHQWIDFRRAARRHVTSNESNHR
jgi:hypothetical protein